MRIRWIVLYLSLITILAGCSANSSPVKEQGQNHMASGSSDQSQVQQGAEQEERDREQEQQNNQQEADNDEQDEQEGEQNVEQAGEQEQDPEQQEVNNSAHEEPGSGDDAEPNQPDPQQPNEHEPMQPVVEFEKKRTLPEGFVYADEVLEHAFYEIRYYSEHNFVGEQIDGYNAPFAILSQQAADALHKAEQALEPLGYSLLIYDAYRPQKAVEHFGKWAEDTQDIKMKDEFYPDIDKKNVFKLGYLAHRSGHSRGSTVDLTLADQATGEPLDMGGIHDFLGEISAHGAAGLTDEQSENRLLLKETMIAAGFEPYRKEWWHYTLKNEPYPKKYFDFDVE